MRARILFLLDETGSMLPYKMTTLYGLRKYFSDLKDKRIEGTATIKAFNSAGTHLLYEGKIEDVHFEDYDYAPAHLTPLYDAMADLIRSGNKKEKTIFIVQTDGLENDSLYTSLEDIRSLVKEYTEAGWEFAFLAGNPFAEEQGIQIGIRDEAVATYVQGREALMAETLVCSTVSYLKGEDMGFTFPTGSATSGHYIDWNTEETDPQDQ